jgi:hypothetical protein
MDTLNSKLPDDKFFSVQEKICKWIQAKGFVTWRQIQKSCKDLLAVYPSEYSSLYGNYPEYKIFMPLFRNGKCEIAKSEEKTGFIYIQKELDKKELMNPLLVLNNYPSINELIINFPIENSLTFKFRCDLKDKYSYKPIDFNISKSKPGIYKADNKPYIQAFLFDGKENRLIPNYNINFDVLNIARCYIRGCEKQRLFIYHQQRKTLSPLIYSELPVLITRALILFDKEQLEDKSFFYPLHKNSPYKNIESSVIDELIRIFGKDSMEVIHD